MPRTQLLGWPLLLFGVALLAAVIRGHERYGESLFSVPLRFVLYAGIAFAISDLKPRDAYRWLVVVFYAGTLWQTGVAIRGYATGATATDQTVLSTGGERVLAGSTAMFMAGALLLALLNLEFQRSARRAALHLLMATLATFALVSTFQRTTFAVASILVPLALLAFRRIGLRAAVYVPLIAPFAVLVALLVPKVDPTFFPTFADRVAASPSTDATAQWRLKAYAAVWGQVREAPLTGVGFGRPARFIANNAHYNVGQDPHNQFLYLWAGGGLLLLRKLLAAARGLLARGLVRVPGGFGRGAPSHFLVRVALVRVHREQPHGDHPHARLFAARVLDPDAASDDRPPPERRPGEARLRIWLRVRPSRGASRSHQR